jgi:Fe-S-cluster-containing dehydrogenase component
MRESRRLLSRREALKDIAAGVAATLLAPASIGLAAQGEYGLLIDTTQCKYCKRCIGACAERHGGENPGTFYTHVDLTNPTGARLAPLAVPFHCMHCVDAPCVKVCQGQALQQTALGAVTLDQSRCVGCLSCINVCPFKQTLTYQAPPARIFKCDMCYDRVVEGLQPACVQACVEAQHDALRSGPLEEMLYEATRRATEANGLVIYPAQTHTLMVFGSGQFNEALLQDLDGITPEYANEARSKAATTQLYRFGWIPFAGGLVYYLVNWRRKLTDQSDKAEGKEE